MILIDNINYLRKNYREIRELLKSIEGSIDKQPIEVLEAKSGMPTVQVLKDRPQLVHSKYDPIREAVNFVDQYADKIEQYQHVFFYGIGMGYHIEAFLKKYQNPSFTLYEPNSTIFYHYVCNRKIEDLPISRLKNIHVEKNENDMNQFLQQFSSKINSNVLLVVLPSYEKILKEQYEVFLKQFREIVVNTRTGLHTSLAFEKRWTINSMMNLPTTIVTPNILHDIDREKFKNKPALIVSAGPSLNEEIENIRHIKESGLAYVFSVGSAINTMIEYGIFPDAACTYDPKQENQIAFKKMIEKGIDTIPLIYGSSVGFETLQNYPGPKIHMVISQDTVTPFYLSQESDIEIERVNDAPSIAVVTLQLLSILGCNPIILVGQNLAYKNNAYYSKGIDYGPVNLSKDQLKSAIKVESVEGHEILTDQAFERMRVQMEMYIKSFKKISYLNTTKGGAKINGTLFLPLEQIIQEKLVGNVVDNDWYKTIEKTDSLESIKQKQKSMDDQFSEFQLLLDRIIKLLIEMERFVDNKKVNELNRQFNKLDREFKRFKNNRFYHVFIAPMIRVQYDITAKEIQSVRFEKDTFYKGKRIISTLSKFIYDCKTDFATILPIYNRIRVEINR